MITNFNDLFAELKAKGICKRMVAAWGVDSHTIEAASLASDKGFVKVTLVGDADMIAEVCNAAKINIDKFTIVDIKDELKAVAEAVRMVHDGEGDVLMKGLCVKMAGFVTGVARSFGIVQPKIAFIAASEQMLDSMPACVEGAMLAKMCDRGQIKAIGDGPLALDVAIDQESVEIKKLNSPVAGDADCLLFPNIESANVFWKTNSKLAKDVRQAGFLVGTKVPCILASRADSVDVKLNSIASAVMSVK